MVKNYLLISALLLSCISSSFSQDKGDFYGEILLLRMGQNFDSNVSNINKIEFDFLNGIEFGYGLTNRFHALTRLTKGTALLIKDFNENISTKRIGVLIGLEAELETWQDFTLGVGLGYNMELIKHQDGRCFANNGSDFSLVKHQSLFRGFQYSIYFSYKFSENWFILMSGDYRSGMNRVTNIKEEAATNISCTPISSHDETIAPISKISLRFLF